MIDERKLNDIASLALAGWDTGDGEYTYDDLRAVALEAARLAFEEARAESAKGGPGTKAGVKEPGAKKRP